MILRRSAAGVLAVAATLMLAACGQGTQTTTGASTSPTTAASATAPSSADASLAAMVPQAVAEDGVITVGTDSTYAPAEFLDTDGKTIIGFDVDLFDAVAARLGLRAQFQSANFGDIITGVTSGKYEMGVSAFTINPERLKQVTMVSYFSAGTSWATKSGNPSGITIDNACGKRVAVQRDTVEVPDITARSAACTKAGKPAITIDQYAGQDQATAAVVSGKDDAMLADSPVVAYAVKQTNGQLQLLGAMYDAAPYGYVVPKDETQLAQAVAKALDALIADGTYRAILDKWGVTQGAVSAAEVNPAV
jgi:polar amino acid transport system substrate-binding protein